MSTTSVLPDLLHPELDTLTALLATTLLAGHHYREDTGLYILDQKCFIKLLKERARTLKCDYTALNGSENADDHRAIQMRILPALRAVEREAEVLWQELGQLDLIAGALERAEDEEMGMVGMNEGDLARGEGLIGGVALPPLVIGGSEDLYDAIGDAMRTYRIDNGLTNQKRNVDFDSGLGSSDEIIPARAATRPPLVIQGTDDIHFAIQDAMEQYRIDNEATQEEEARATPPHRYDVTDDAAVHDIHIATQDATEQHRLNNEADTGENADEGYEAATGSFNEGTATASSTESGPEAHSYSGNNLVPMYPFIRTPNLPRFDDLAVPGSEGYVMRQKRWIDARVAIDDA
ncbi:hypothetical protein EG328_008528 [Venturia inaequalis]|uniref:Uncharacterized protein n=1 Tax=Venturia inaequalis TaxID=5025 RepID=A0A8H3UC95_VENIN|nr:hypothetical protein EG328_008528 [Venturia inaequalis]